MHHPLGIKVQLFWEGCKIFGHLILFFFDITQQHQIISWRWAKFLWPSQNIWTLQRKLKMLNKYSEITKQSLYEGNSYLVFYVPFAKGASRWRLPFSTTRGRGMSHIRALIDRCTNHGSYRTAHGYDLKVMSWGIENRTRVGIRIPAPPNSGYPSCTPTERTIFLGVVTRFVGPVGTPEATSLVSPASGVAPKTRSGFTRGVTRNSGP